MNSILLVINTIITFQSIAECQNVGKMDLGASSLSRNISTRAERMENMANTSGYSGQPFDNLQPMLGYSFHDLIRISLSENYLFTENDTQHSAIKKSFNTETDDDSDDDHDDNNSYSVSFNERDNNCDEDDENCVEKVKYHRTMLKVELKGFSYFQNLKERRKKLFSKRRYRKMMKKGRFPDMTKYLMINAKISQTIFTFLKNILTMLWSIIEKIKLLSGVRQDVSDVVKFIINMWKSSVGIPGKALVYNFENIRRLIERVTDEEVPDLRSVRGQETITQIIEAAADDLDMVSNDTKYDPPLPGRPIEIENEILFGLGYPDSYKIDTVPPHPLGWEMQLRDQDLKPSYSCGYPAEANLWRFLVSLHYHNHGVPTMLFCVGSLIHQKWALTAGHCVRPTIHPVFRWLFGNPKHYALRNEGDNVVKNEEYVIVKVGCYNQLDEKEGQLIPSSKWVVHPNYTGYEYYKAGQKFTYLAPHDIGMYQLDNDVWGRFVLLGNGFPRIGAKDRCRGAGWGVHYTIFYTSEHQKECKDPAYHYPLRGLLYEHTMSVLSPGFCQKFIKIILERHAGEKLPPTAPTDTGECPSGTQIGPEGHCVYVTMFDTSMMFCSQSVPDVTAHYRIDMGSPLICDNRLMAIASIVDEFVVWVQVGYYLEWINLTMKEQGDMIRRPMQVEFPFANTLGGSPGPKLGERQREETLRSKSVMPFVTGAVIVIIINFIIVLR